MVNSVYFWGLGTMYVFIGAAIFTAAALYNLDYFYRNRHKEYIERKKLEKFAEHQTDSSDHKDETESESVRDDHQTEDQPCQ